MNINKIIINLNNSKESAYKIIDDNNVELEIYTGNNLLLHVHEDEFSDMEYPTKYHIKNLLKRVLEVI